MTIFSDQVDPNTVTVEDLVGEGKKYATIEDLAKSRIHADLTIAARERELAEAREEINKRMTYEELAEQLARKDEREAPRVHEQPPAPANPAIVPPVKDEDLAARIREIQQQDKREERLQSNITEVTNRMLQEFGSEAKASEYVAGKARELGVTVQFLQDQAAQAPRAFFKTVGLEDNVSPPARPTGGNVNTDALRTQTPGTGPKPDTYAYFEEMRRTDPARYFLPATQNKLMKAALEKGDAFFNR